MKSHIAKANINVTISTHPHYQDITLLSVKGFIDTNTAPEFEKSFQLALAQKKFNIIIDLKEATYVSSAGWGIFVGEIKRIRGQKGNLVLACMSPEVAEAYDLLQFDSIIKAFPTVVEAVHKGFGKPQTGAGAPAAPSKKRTKKGFEPAAAVEGPAPETKVFSANAVTPEIRKKWRLIHLFMPWKWR